MNKTNIENILINGIIVNLLVYFIFLLFFLNIVI